MKYPIGIQSFDQVIEGGYLYIDKTKYIYDLAHGSKAYFLGRPRRFGKSLLISTLECYFKGRKDCLRDLLLMPWRRNGRNILLFILTLMV